MYALIKLLFRNYVLRYKYGYLIGLLALLATDIFMLLRPKIIGHAIDNLRTPEPVHTLGWFVLIFLAVVILENIFRIVWRRVLVGTSRLVENKLMNDYFAKLLTLDQRFYNSVPTGDLMARATNDVVSIRMLLGPGVMALFDTFVIASFSIFFMIHISTVLTIYALIPIPILSVFLYVMIRNVQLSFDAVQAQFSTMTARAQENLSGIRVIKAHTREDHEIKEFDQTSTAYIDKYMHLTRYEAAIEPLIRLITGIGVVITIFAGGHFVIMGKITFGQFVQFFLYLMGLTWPVIAVGWATSLVQRGFTSLARIKKIFDESPKIFDLTGCGQEESGNGRFPKGDIEFSHVCFKYHVDSPEVLQGIDLVIKQGATLGIVGPTGSGKTSLVNLIPRIFDPTGGNLTIGGRQVQDIPLSLLRSKVGFVPQEPFLFSKDINGNVQPGQAQLDRDNICHALRLAQLDNELEDFPEGAGTVVGERGVRLSGGQKQRLTIARAIAKDPEIVIFDDAFSSVDAQTENLILSNLKQFMKGRTTIIISHRVSPVKDADLIVVIEDGRITEQGRHQELLAKKGFYRRLYEQQQILEKLEKL